MEIIKISQPIGIPMLDPACVLPWRSVLSRPILLYSVTLCSIVAPDVATGGVNGTKRNQMTQIMTKSEPS